MLRTPRIRLLFLASLPLVFSAIVMSVVVSEVTERRLQAQSDHFSKTQASYLAMTIAEHLVNHDLLGINVLLSRMLEDSALEFASVYDAKDQLIAQVGRRTNNQSTAFSSEVTFQNTTAGYVQVGFNTEDITAQSHFAVVLVLGFHLALFLFVCGFVLFVGDFAAIWILGPASQNNEPSGELEEPEAGLSPAEPRLAEDHAATILVVKLRPARLMERYRDQFKQGINLYNGKTIEHEGEDLLVCFYGESGRFQSVCAALLLLKLVEQVGPPLKLKIGMHWIADTQEQLAFEKATKHASYLASIDEQTVLVSRTFERELATIADIEYDSFHSSLTPDGEVFQVRRVKNQALIESQALQLLNA